MVSSGKKRWWQYDPERERREAKFLAEQGKRTAGAVGGAARGAGRWTGEQARYAGTAVGGATKEAGRRARSFWESPFGSVADFFRSLGISGGRVLQILVIILLIIFAVWAIRNAYGAGLFGVWTDKYIKTPIANLERTPVVQFFKRGLGLLGEAELAGDVWRGNVDKYSKERLGLYINKFEPYQYEFSAGAGDPRMGDDVILFADVEIAGFPEYTESEKDRKFYNLECGVPESWWGELEMTARETLSEKERKEKEREFKVKGTIYPPYSSKEEGYRIREYEEMDYECRLGNYGALKSKLSTLGRSVLVMLKADYDFDTKSYLKVYLMDDEEKRALRGKGIDVFKNFGITEKVPIESVYTNGPVEVGIGVGRGEAIQPLGLVKDEANIKYLGITLNNRWDGEISEIENIILQLPNGTTLTTKNTPACPFKNPKTVGDFVEYSFNNDVAGIIYPIDNYVTFRCYVEMDYDELSKDETGKIKPVLEFKQVYYHIKATYKYATTKTSTVQFRDLPEEKPEKKPVSLGDFSGTGNYLWPVSDNYKTITSCYGKRETGDKFHDGFDISIPTGTPVRAVDSGVVISTCEGWCDGYGNNVRIKHTGDLYTQYAHLSEILVKRGQGVQRGEHIGNSGSTGISTGPHLDIKFSTNPSFSKDTADNALCYLSAKNLIIKDEDCCSCSDTRNKKPGCFI